MKQSLREDPKTSVQKEFKVEIRIIDNLGEDKEEKYRNLRQAIVATTLKILRTDLTLPAKVTSETLFTSYLPIETEEYRIILTAAVTK